MARMTVVLVVACFVAWLPARHEAQTVGRAPAALDAAREACGGRARLAAVNSMRLTGRYENRNQFYGQTAQATQEFLPGDLQVQHVAARALPRQRAAGRRTDGAPHRARRRHAVESYDPARYRRAPGRVRRPWRPRARSSLA